MTKYKYKTTRQGVFETNSSSCHSVSICSTGQVETLQVTGGIVRLNYEEYGWSGPTCYSPYEKACYAATWVRNYGTDEQFDMFLEAIREQTKAAAVEIEEAEDSYYDSGSIDHQSIDTVEDFFVDKDTLKDFIFNSRYSIKIDHDNH